MTHYWVRGDMERFTKVGSIKGRIHHGSGRNANNSSLCMNSCLQNSIWDLLHSGAIARLPLATKVKIVAGTARAMVYLQKLQVNNAWPKVHESILDDHNILLDEDFTAELSD